MPSFHDSDYFLQTEAFYMHWFEIQIYKNAIYEKGSKIFEVGEYTIGFKITKSPYFHLAGREGFHNLEAFL